MYEEVEALYRRFRLEHYKSLFHQIKEIDGSLSATEAFAVDVIYLLGNPTIKQFSDYLGISQPNATYKVGNLIAKGYVVKEPSQEDRREYRLSVAEKFYRYNSDRSQFIANGVKALEERFSAELLETFRAMLRVLGEATV